MREIKFRAWDKRRNRMRFGNDNLLISLGGYLFWDVGYKEPEMMSKEETNEYILMQYTGLKDKNGKEIYEGDIVQPFYTVAGYGRKQEVRWGIGVWEPFDENCDSDHSSRYEVIGNIYENPE